MDDRSGGADDPRILGIVFIGQVIQRDGRLFGFRIDGPVNLFTVLVLQVDVGRYGFFFSGVGIDPGGISFFIPGLTGLGWVFLDIFRQIMKFLGLLNMFIEYFFGHQGIDAADFRMMKNNGLCGFERRFDAVGMQVDFFSFA